MVGYRNFLGLSVCLSERYRKVFTVLSYPPFYRCRMFVCHTDAEQWSYRAGLPPFYFSCVVCFSVRQIQDSTLTMLGYWCVFWGDICLSVGQILDRTLTVLGYWWVFCDISLPDRYWTELLPCWVTGGFLVSSAAARTEAWENTCQLVSWILSLSAMMADMQEVDNLVQLWGCPPTSHKYH